MLELINKYNNVIDKIEEIFKTNYLEIKRLRELWRRYFFYYSNKRLLYFRYLFCDGESKIYIDNINTSTYYQITQKYDIRRYRKIIITIIKKKIVDNLNYLW